MALLGCGCIRDGLGDWGFGFFAGFGLDLHLDVRGDFAVQLDGHGEFADALERLSQLNLAAINLKALGC